MFRRTAVASDATSLVKISELEKKVDGLTESVVTLLDHVKTQTDVIRLQAKDIADLKSMISSLLAASTPPRSPRLRKFSSDSWSPRGSSGSKIFESPSHPSPHPFNRSTSRIRIELDISDSDSEGEGEGEESGLTPKARSTDPEVDQASIEIVLFSGADDSGDAPERLIGCIYPVLNHEECLFSKSLAWHLSCDQLRHDKHCFEQALEASVSRGWVRRNRAGQYRLCPACPRPDLDFLSSAEYRQAQQLRYWAFWANELKKLNTIESSHWHLRQLISFIQSTACSPEVLPIAMEVAFHLPLLSAVGTAVDLAKLAATVFQVLCGAETGFSIDSDLWNNASCTHKEAMLMCHMAITEPSAWTSAALDEVETAIQTSDLSERVAVRLVLLRAAAADARGDVMKALQIVMEALFRWKDVDRKTAHVATLLHCQGSLLGKAGQRDEAFQVLLQAKAVRQQLRDWELATTLMALASLADEMGNVKHASTLADAAVESRRKAFGPKHLMVADALAAWAEVLAKMGKKDSALERRSEALEIKMAWLGPIHEEVAFALFARGVAQDEVGRPGLALASFEECLAMKQKLEAFDSALEANCLNSMGIVLKKLGCKEEALKKYADCTSLRRGLKELPEQLLELGTVLHAMAILLDELNKPSESLQCFQEAVSVRQAMLGSHVATADSLFSVGIMLKKLDKKEEALCAYTGCLAMRKAVLGEDHEAVAVTLRTIAITLDSLRRHEEALALFQQALDVRRVVHGKEHALVADCLLSLGIVLKALGRKEEAAEKYKECVDMRLRLLGPQHPSVIAAMRTLSGLLRELGKSDVAAGMEAKL